MTLYVAPSEDRTVVRVGTFSGRNGKLVDHALLTREEALRTATAMLTSALSLPCGQSTHPVTLTARNAEPGA